MNVETVDNAGIQKLKRFHMVNIKEFPRGISDQVISGASATAPVQRALDPGYKPQAASTKLQAASALKL